jgi:hypothetical protein
MDREPDEPDLHLPGVQTLATLQTREGHEGAEDMTPHNHEHSVMLHLRKQSWAVGLSRSISALRDQRSSALPLPGLIRTVPSSVGSTPKPSQVPYWWRSRR